MIRFPDEMLRAMQVERAEVRVKPERKPWRWPWVVKVKPVEGKARLA